MSYRELRDLTEILRTLNFSRHVSIENFRLPNFEVMSEILEWVVFKFNPNIRIPRNINSETDRIIFIKTCVLTLIQKARVRLNPKHLYQSDGHAVREILIVLKMLYASNKEKFYTLDSSNKTLLQTTSTRSKVNSARQDMRKAMHLSIHIPQIAVNVYDLLSKEVVVKKARNKALSQLLNANEIEQELNEIIKEKEKKAAQIQYKLSNIVADEKDLEKKIERRHQKFDQLQNRLVKLQSFRPPYMDEYERYEKKLKQLYDTYTILFCNLSYLQQQLWDIERNEHERLTKAEQNMRLAVDKMRMENDISIPPILAGLELEDSTLTGATPPKVFGNMIGDGLSDDDDDNDDDDIVEDKINAIDIDRDVEIENDLQDDILRINNINNKLISDDSFSKNTNYINKNNYDNIKHNNIGVNDLEAIIENDNEENTSSTDDF